MPIPSLLCDIPFDDAMFPDVVTFTPVGYATGIHAGTTPVDGTPITLSCYVEVTTNPMMRDEGMGANSSGVVMDQTLYNVFFRDTNTGNAPVPIGTDTKLIWTTSQGKVFTVPRTLLAKGPADRQGSTWLVSCREMV